MSNDNNSPTNPPQSLSARRSSMSSNTFANLFARSNSTAGAAGTTNGNSGVSPFPGPISTAAAQDHHRRRMSISASLGLTGTSPTQQTSPFGGMSAAAARRSSVSTAGSESIDENAIDDDDAPGRGSNPTTPFARRMSLGAQAFRQVRTGNSSPGTSAPSSGKPPPSNPSSLAPIRDDDDGGGRGEGGVVPRSPSLSSSPLQASHNGSRQHNRSPSTSSSASSSSSSNNHYYYSSYQASTQPRSRTKSDFSSSARSAEGLNWSEHFRSRAESAVSSRPPVVGGGSGGGGAAPSRSSMTRERAGSVADMPGPPTATIPSVATPKPRKQPDAFGERMLKGDFYMD